MDDPLLKLKRISNPTAVGLYELNGKRIVLLGDMHIPNARDCSRCVLPNCADYLTIIKALDRYHKEQGTELDVFLETFGVEDMKSKLQKSKWYLMDKINPLLNSLIHEKGLHLLKVRKELDRKVFFHGRDELQRYHTFDFRITPLFKEAGFDTLFLLRSMVSEEKQAEANDILKSMYPTKKDLYAAVTTMCFSKKRPYNRIAKQVYKLSPQDQALVKRFFKNYFDLYYKQLQKDRVDLHFTLAVLMTDIYSISRFLRFHHRQVAGSTSVFLAGARHTWHYSQFLKELGARKIFDNHPGKLLETGDDMAMLELGQCQRIKWLHRFQ